MDMKQTVVAEFRYAGDPLPLTGYHGVIDLRAELAAFNEARRKLLRGQPIDPEGESVLMPPGERE